MKLRELQPVLRQGWVDLSDEDGECIDMYEFYNDVGEFCGCEEMFEKYGDKEVMSISEFEIVIKKI